MISKKTGENSHLAAAAFGTDQDRIPPQIPDHALLRCVGRGSYGEVWLARNVMGTYRAVKIVYRQKFDDARPFQREYHGIQKFEPISRSHEGLMDILQVGQSEAEQSFYYVMELADDLSSGRQIDPTRYRPRTLRCGVNEGGCRSPGECVALGLALTDALSAMHRHGLVHRDIKPSNIIFVNGVPKLADIGLVTSLDATLTYVGTEGFMPPEGPGAPQGDVYSLGKVLYEISTGKDRQEFPVLSTSMRTSAERKELLELNEVLVKACAFDPRKRYKTAEEMHTDLALLNSGQSIIARRRRERGLTLAFRGLALVSMLSLAVLLNQLWNQRQDRELRDAALLQMRKSHMLSLARILASNLTAALAFNNQGDAEDVLSSLSVAEPKLKAAVFDRNTNVVATYPRSFTNAVDEYRVVGAGFHQNVRRIILVTAILENHGAFVKHMGRLVLEGECPRTEQ